MLRLSEAQRRALQALYAGREWDVSRERFATMENLRKRGYAERHSTYVTRGIYADKSGEHRQPAWRGWWHRWFITPAGRAALSHKEKDNE